MKHPHRWRRTCALLAISAVPLQAAALLPLGSTTITNLAFGSFAAGSGGAVIVSPAGVRTSSGSVVLLSRGTWSAAQLSVTGEPNTTYAIQLPPDGSVVLSAPSGQSMAVNTFVSTPGGSGHLGSGGSQTLAIGATLRVGANQVPASYSGSFQVSLNYN